MNFKDDAFISYSHLDNVPLHKGGTGWVDNLRRALEVRVAQHLGRRPRIWQDKRLRGNDVFADELIGRLRQVASLVSVVSPAYTKSDWTRKELLAFWKAAEEQGGVRIRELSRIFKVLKTPVPRENLSPELEPLLGYEFFKKDESQHVREFDEIFGPDAKTEFWIKLDDLAYDMCSLLETLENPQEALRQTAGSNVIYLAETSSDLKEQRAAIKRDLLEHGYKLLPDQPLPLVASELEAAVRDNLAKCRMSIHLIGKSYSIVPEGGVQSILEIQNELAIERGEKGGFSRLVWIPAGLSVEDDRQKKIIERLRMDPRVQKGTDLLETSLEDLRTMIQERLKQAPEPKEKPIDSEAIQGNIPRIYLIYDRRDVAVAAPWAGILFEQGFEVVRPVFEGDEAEIREYHQENLCTCNGVLILYGSANEAWLARKLGDVRKSPGWGRTKPLPVVAIALLPPKTTEKETFRTHEAITIPQWDGVSVDSLRPFISRMSA